MKEYELLFKGTRFEHRAEAFAAKVKDVSEFLDSLRLIDPKSLPATLTVAYHDACHLATLRALRLRHAGC